MRGSLRARPWVPGAVSVEIAYAAHGRTGNLECRIIARVQTRPATASCKSKRIRGAASTMMSAELGCVVAAGASLSDGQPQVEPTLTSLWRLTPDIGRKIPPPSPLSATDLGDSVPSWPDLLRGLCAGTRVAWRSWAHSSASWICRRTALFQRSLMAVLLEKGQTFIVLHGPRH